MPRAIWKGAISFGLVHIPVELFPAESRKGLDLDLLDRRDFAPVGYKRYNKETGRDIEWNDIVKGYEYEKGKYVVLSDEDLKRANVEATQTVDILGFVDADEIPVIYYEQPYYLAPSRGGDKVYVLLRETLKRANKVGIAQVVIRTKQHMAALLPMGDVIVLDLLRYHDEIRKPNELNLPDARSKKAAVTDKEIDMALSLLEDMTGPWDPDQYHDTYHDDVMALVERKIAADQTELVTEPEPGADRLPAASNVVDLMGLLKRSIEQKGRKAKGVPAAQDEQAVAPKRKASATPIAAARAKPKTEPKSEADKPARKSPTRAAAKPAEKPAAKAAKPAARRTAQRSAAR